VLYNYGAGYTTHTSTNFQHDILNNYFIFGPASTGTDDTWFQVDKNQSIYYAGNLKDTNLNGALDGATTTPFWYQGPGTILTTPWSTETTATPALDTASAYRVALSRAGAFPRDPIDELILSQIATLGKGTTGQGAGTVGPDSGFYTSQAQTGLANNGYGAIAAGTRLTDTDNDGMPDVWETANGTNPGTNHEHASVYSWREQKGFLQEFRRFRLERIKDVLFVVLRLVDPRGDRPHAHQLGRKWHQQVARIGFDR